MLKLKRHSDFWNKSTCFENDWGQGCIIIIIHINLYGGSFPA